MAISSFTLFTLTFCAVVIGALGAGAELRRRLRNARLVQIAAVTAAGVLIPANLYCAITRTGAEGRASAVSLLVTTVSLAALSGILILAMTLRIPQVPTRLPRRILAIGAHPDDIELACGGTIAKLVDSGHEVQVLVMSNGGLGGDSAKRLGEAATAGTFLGTTAVKIMGFTDTRLGDDDFEMVQAIEGEVRRLNPDIILTHSSNDQHQDHHAVHVATLRAARQHPAVLCYESPSATCDFQPSVFIDIENYLDVKVAAVGAHHDQQRKPYMEPERVRALAVHRGLQAKVRYAEGYEPVRLLSSPMVGL